MGLLDFFNRDGTKEDSKELKILTKAKYTRCIFCTAEGCMVANSKDNFVNGRVVTTYKLKCLKCDRTFNREL